MKPDHIHMKCPGKGPGASKNLKVMVKLHMVSLDMINMVKGNFM